MKPMALKSRILIAGGAGGVGLACAEALSRRGAEIILCDIDGIALTNASNRLNAFARFCDAIEENSVAIFAAEMTDRYSSIDALINAAGHGYVRALAMMRMTRAFMPLLRRAEGRRMLVNVAPAGGFVSSEGMFPHGSSAGAFERLSEALAEQVKGTSISVATIVPRLRHSSFDKRTPEDHLYQLRRVDEEHTAERIADLLSGGDRLVPAALRRAFPTRNF